MGAVRKKWDREVNTFPALVARQSAQSGSGLTEFVISGNLMDIIKTEQCAAASTEIDILLLHQLL